MVNRELYLRKVRPFIGTDVIKVISGMRRSGKSVLLELIQAELRERNPEVRIFSVNLDDDENKRFLAKGVLYEHVNKLLQEAGSEMVYLFFDEIHDVEEWETAVNSLRMRKNADIYITGSNSKLLSGELATYLTGRYVEIKMTPFSFAEFIEAAKPIFPEEDKSQLFNRYLMTGGIPFLAKVRYDEEASRAYLHDLYGAILLKDVVRRGTADRKLPQGRTARDIRRDGPQLPHGLRGGFLDCARSAPGSGRQAHSGGGREILCDGYGPAEHGRQGESSS